MHALDFSISERAFDGPVLFPALGSRISLCSVSDSPQEQFQPRFGTSNRLFGFSQPEEQSGSSGKTPPPQKEAPPLVFGEFPRRVFLRLPKRPGRELWGLSYGDLRRLISPGSWNKNSPPVQAHLLCKPGADRGIPLIDYSSLLNWLNGCFRRSGTFGDPIPVPKIELPPVLHIPPPGQECPYTSLRHTVMYELARICSPYGRTGILFTPYSLPGSAKRAIAIETQSLLRYIRSLPPPQYKIPPRSACIYRKPRRSVVSAK